MHLPRIFALPLLVFGLASAVWAQEMDSSEFAARAQALGDGINAGGAESAHCLELKRRADDLVGHPQRRNTAMQEYRATCQGGSEPALPGDPMNRIDRLPY